MSYYYQLYLRKKESQPWHYSGLPVSCEFDISTITSL